MTTTKTRGKRDNPYLLDDLLVTMHRSALGRLWRWRTETLMLTCVASALAWLSGQITLTWAAVVLAAAAVILFTVPVTRRFLIARFWCVLSRHRFQRVCFEARLHTRTGRVPPVLWVRPTKVGERLTVWCRAGVAVEDFEQHTGEIRAACYAREARVTMNTRWSQIVTIDIIRHDTLAANRSVASALLHRLTVIHDRDGRLSPTGTAHSSPPKTVIPGQVIPPQARPGTAAGSRMPRPRPHQAITDRK